VNNSRPARRSRWRVAVPSRLAGEGEVIEKNVRG
jgi:hypothetical protein